MVYGYIRVSTDRQTVENQRFEIKQFCKKERLVVVKWIEETISGTREPGKRRLGTLLNDVQQGDLIIYSELSRLGRSFFMIMSILSKCMNQGVKI
jgi:DNA invertase Pin-like site-specific DNA recombinase